MPSRNHLQNTLTRRKKDEDCLWISKVIHLWNTEVLRAIFSEYYYEISDKEEEE